MGEKTTLTPNPFISVIIPTFNRLSFLPAALESIWSQEYQPLEVIIIDDGSTDATPQLLTELSDRIVSARQENLGPAAARNRGLKLAHGEVLAFLDSDDLWPPGKLRLQLPYLYEPFNYDYVTGLTKYVRLSGGRPLLPIQAQPNAAVNLSSCLFKRAVFDKVGVFDTTFRLGSDMDWLQRARTASLRHTAVSEVTSIYHFHAGNLTNDRTAVQQYVMRVLRKNAERNRVGTGRSDSDAPSLPPSGSLVGPTESGVENSRPLVSIIVPVYNGEKYISLAIESILSQTYRPIEVIAINDGSTDSTAECLEAFSPSISIFEQPNQGLPAALNTGLAHATGEMVAFLDADDLWSPEKLALQVAYLESHPEISMLFSYVQQFISPELDEEEKKTLVCPNSAEPGIHKITILVRRPVFERVGVFNSTYKLGEFLDWYARAEDAGYKSHMLPEVLAMRRVHKSHTTDRSTQAAKGYVQALKAALDRRRANEADRQNDMSEPK
jgi:glycosyltransferase involved in cell wall biosynthesis